MRTQAGNSHSLVEADGRAPERVFLFFIIATLGLAIDLGSKSYVFSSLGYPGGQSSWMKSWFGNWLTFRFWTNINEGALWGIGQGKSFIFASLSVVAAIGVLVAILRYKVSRSLWLTFSLGLILAGTLGNLWDRVGLHQCSRPDGSIIYGVRDFLLFTFGEFHWPVFNFADVFLVTGSIMLGVESIRAEASTRANAASPALVEGSEALHKSVIG